MNKTVLLEASLEIQEMLQTSGANVSQSLLNSNLKNMNKKVLLTTAIKMQKKLPISNNLLQADQDTQETQVINNSNNNNLSQQSTSSNHELQLNQNIINKSSKSSESDTLVNDLTELVNNLKYRLHSVEVKLYEAEVRINKFEQYTRRENLEISGIPDNINQDQLENTVLRILESIGVQTDSYHISACHRLSRNKKQQSANTIIRFTDRKIIYDIFSKKKNLKVSPMKDELGSDLYITENLSPEFKNIFETCKYLKRKNVIHSCWTYNGNVNIKISDYEGEKPIKIFHYNDIGHYVIDAYKFIKVN